MSKTYKYRLLKDLPEYPKDCVFILNEDGWRGYWDTGDWTIPEWLENLLYRNVPEILDEMTDWFEPIVDNETTVYEVNIRGDIRKRNIYSFWLYSPDISCVFEDKKKAEEIAKQIKNIFAEESK